jgi:hypothetical protein
MSSLQLSQNLRCRQTLIQQLGLESEFLGSCLVRTEMRLKESRFQRPLHLLRGLVDESDFSSVLDWLLVLYAPVYADTVRDYYRLGRGRMMELCSSDEIDEVDRMLDEELVRLADLSSEIWMLGIYKRRKEAKEIAAMYLEMLARPRFDAFLEAA